MFEETTTVIIPTTSAEQAKARMMRLKLKAREEAIATGASVLAFLSTEAAARTAFLMALSLSSLDERVSREARDAEGIAAAPETEERDFPSRRAVKRSRLIFSAKSWRRLSSSARRSATEFAAERLFELWDLAPAGVRLEAEDGFAPVPGAVFIYYIPRLLYLSLIITLSSLKAQELFLEIKIWYNIYNMDEEEKRKRMQTIRIVCTEIFMTLSVIALGVFLTLIVSGYSFNLKGLQTGEEVVERLGLIQVSSIPSGASVEIDGATNLLARTNMSKTLSAGERNVRLSREGYEDWSKTVEITEGLMYRLNYPRLFLSERPTELAKEYVDVKSASVSPDGTKMIVFDGKTVELIELDNIKQEAKTLATNGLLDLKEFKVLEWSGNGERIVAEVNGDLFVMSVSGSETATKLAKALTVKFETATGDRVLILDLEHELREVNVKNGGTESLLVEDVISFDNNGEMILYAKKNKEGEIELRSYQVGATTSAWIGTGADEKAQFLSMKYFQEYYILTYDQGKLKVAGTEEWPKGDEVEIQFEDQFEAELKLENVKATKAGKGMVFYLDAGEEKAVYDIEAGELVRYTEEAYAEDGWVDEFLRYRIDNEGGLEVFDYDGTNKLTLTDEGVLSKGVVAISGNGKWLYYFRADAEGGKIQLERMKIN